MLILAHCSWLSLDLTGYVLLYSGSLGARTTLGPPSKLTPPVPDAVVSSLHRNYFQNATSGCLLLAFFKKDDEGSSPE